MLESNVDVGPSNQQGKQRSWRGFFKFIELTIKQLESLEHNLTQGEKREAFCRLLEHHSVEDVLPDCVINGKLFEANKGILQSMKATYGTLVGTRQSFNLTFKNILLLFVVSSNVASNQRHIARSLGALKYSIKNVVVRRIHVDQIR
jgi:hypothetical protein